MTITLEPETESKLSEKAKREGRTIDALANDLLAEILEQEAREFAQNVAAIKEGFEAIAAGKEKPLEQYIAEQREKRGLPESWPSSTSVSETTHGVAVASE